MMTESELWQAAESVRLMKQNFYKRDGDCISYVTVAPVSRHFRDACAVKNGDSVVAFAVYFDELFVLACRPGISDKAVSMLRKILHRAWLRPDLKLLPGQDDAFYSGLAGRLDVEVC